MSDSVTAKVVEEIKLNLCEGEIEAFKICNQIGLRNYRNSTTGNTQNNNGMTHHL